VTFKITIRSIIYHKFNGDFKSYVTFRDKKGGKSPTYSITLSNISIYDSKSLSWLCGKDQPQNLGEKTQIRKFKENFHFFF
jgi:nicotinic acid mononucleotide adenylyltransferase